MQDFDKYVEEVKNQLEYDRMISIERGNQDSHDEIPFASFEAMEEIIIQKGACEICLAL